MKQLDLVAPAVPARARRSDARALRSSACGLRQAIEDAAAAWQVDEPGPQPVRPVGRGIRDVVRRLSASTARGRSVSRMQPAYRFDPESSFTVELFEQARAGRLRLQVVVDALTERQHPLLHAISGGGARVAPVFLQMAVLDGGHVICAGPPTDEGDVTAWILREEGLRHDALDLWRNTWAASRPIEPAHPCLRLSPRQVLVARRLCLGSPDRAVARELDISVRSVERDIAGLLEYLGARSRPEAILMMLGRGANSRGVHD